MLYSGIDMADITLEDISHLAVLARLNLSEDEKKQFSTQIPAIVAFVDQLQKVQIVEKADNQAVALANMREDVVGQEHLSPEQLAKLAGQNWDTNTNQLQVPAVFGEVADE